MTFQPHLSKHAVVQAAYPRSVVPHEFQLGCLISWWTDSMSNIRNNFDQKQLLLRMANKACLELQCRTVMDYKYMIRLSIEKA